MHVYHMGRLSTHLVSILFRNFIIALTCVLIYHQTNTETWLMLQLLTSLWILIHYRLILLSITLIYSIWILVVLEETFDIIIWRVIGKLTFFIRAFFFVGIWRGSRSALRACHYNRLLLILFLVKNRLFSS